jgi:AcrR family transcriptional regulator
MARRPARKTRARRVVAAAPASDPRGKVIDALLALAGERSFGAGLADVAAAAGVPLATLRSLYNGKLGILADFSRRIDEGVLDKGPAEGKEARDRLFEVVMRRFDALAPFRPALGSILAAARRDLALARALHRIARKSQMWMLVAAGIHRGGITGRMAMEGMVFVYANVFRVFLDDEDAGLARTMAALDRGLGRGERWMGWLDRVCSVIPDFGERLRSRRRGAEAEV